MTDFALCLVIELTKLFRNETKEWYHVRVNGEEIVCTGGHPFYVLNADEDRNVVLYEDTKTDTIGKWITAKELKLSDKLLLSDGTCAIIEAVQVEKFEKPETTYNFEVEDFHTYYVGINRILSHNMCAKKGFESKSFNVDGEVGPYKDIRIDVEYAGADHYTMHLQYKGGPGSPAKLPFDTSINKFVGEGAEIFHASNKVKRAVVRASKYVKSIGGKLHW